MASSTAGDADDPVREIRLVDDGEWWVATDVEREVTTQGETRASTLENLDEAVALHEGEAGRPPTDADLREAGIDPADNETGEDEHPDVLD